MAHRSSYGNAEDTLLVIGHELAMEHAAACCETLNALGFTDAEVPKDTLMAGFCMVHMPSGKPYGFFMEISHLRRAKMLFLFYVDGMWKPEFC